MVGKRLLQNSKDALMDSPHLIQELLRVLKAQGSPVLNSFNVSKIGGNSSHNSD